MSSDIAFSNGNQYVHFVKLDDGSVIMEEGIWGPPTLTPEQVKQLADWLLSGTAGGEQR